MKDQHSPDYLTEHDVARIMHYIVHCSSSYEGESIFSFTRNKASSMPPLNEIHIDDYTAFKMHQEVFGDDKCFMNRTSYKGVFSASPCIEVISDRKSWIEETLLIDCVSRGKQLEEMKNSVYFKHAAQLYCADHDFVLVKLVYANSSKNPISKVINRSSWHYKKFLSKINELEEVFRSYQRGVEHFSHAEVNARKLSKIPERLRDEIVNIKRERDKAQDHLARIKSREHTVIDALNRIGIKNVEVDDLLVSVVQRGHKVVKEKFKEAVHRVELQVRNFKHDRFQSLEYQAGESLYEVPEDSHYLKYSNPKPRGKYE